MTLHSLHQLCDLESHIFFYIFKFNPCSCFFLSHSWPQGLVLFGSDDISKDIYKRADWLQTAQGSLQRSLSPGNNNNNKKMVLIKKSQE